MLSINRFLSTSAMKTFRPWLSCHCALGLLFPGSLGAVVISQVIPFLILMGILMFSLIYSARFVNVHHRE